MCRSFDIDNQYIKYKKMILIQLLSIAWDGMVYENIGF